MSGRRRHDLWVELGVSMRRVRLAAQASLRSVETRSGWGRGTLSQVETAKLRPPLALVEWYDEHLGGDGVLVGLFVAAQTWSGRDRAEVPSVVEALPGDELAVEAVGVAAGQLVEPDEELKLFWTLRNSGSVPWAGRSLRRVGPLAAARLITSRRLEPLPECAPGAAIDVVIAATVPGVPGPVVAYWEMVGADTSPNFPGRVAVSAVLMVRG